MKKIVLTILCALAFSGTSSGFFSSPSLNQTIRHNPYDWKSIESALALGAKVNFETLKLFIEVVQTYTVDSQSPDFFPKKSLQLLLDAGGNPVEKGSLRQAGTAQLQVSTGEWETVPNYVTDPSLEKVLEDLAQNSSREPEIREKYWQGLKVVHEWKRVRAQESFKKMQAFKEQYRTE